MKNVQFNDLSLNFDQQPILKSVTAKFTVGKIHLLTEASGSSKSTALKLIVGLLPEYGGEIVAGAVDIPTDAHIGVVFQDPLMQLALDASHHELEFTLENYRVPIDEAPERVKEALQFGKVGDFANWLITTLLGGQQQRATLATATAMQPNVLLSNEPFANIDEENW